MPAVTADPLTLTRLPRLPEQETAWRPVARVVTAERHLEGEGFQVRRPFPGVSLALADPFLLLDHMGAVEYAPGEAKGTPWHPHRGFETVTYIIDGAFQHQDTTGGGGLIADGATQWMTAGAGICLPTRENPCAPENAKQPRLRYRGSAAGAEVKLRSAELPRTTRLGS